MKKLITIFAFFSLSQGVLGASSNTIKIDDVAKKVSSNNFQVYQNALQVYQAKANIEKARADLLPRLSIWTIGRAIFDPLSLVDQITDVAPFLVPANWFRNNEVKLLYLAEKEGYRALWANEVNVAKTLYIHLLYDQKLLEHVRKSRSELQRIYTIVKTRETFGGVTPGTSRDIQIKILGLNEDEQNLKVLIDQEKDQLSFLLGMSAGVKLAITPISLSFASSLKKLDPEDLEFRALSQSPERRQFEHFLSVLSQVKKEIQYSVFGVSSISRGAAGGIFDAIPISGGFGNAASMKIADAQREIIVSQKKAVEETVKRQLRSVLFQANSDVLNFSSFQQRAALAGESKESLIRRLQLGENINMVDLAEVSRNQIQAQTALFAVQFRMFTSQDRLNRLIFSGDYANNPPLIQSLNGSSK